MARPFAAPPGVPADRIKLLRAAFMKAVADPAYLEEGKKQKLELTPKSGEEVQATWSICPYCDHRLKGGAAPSPAAAPAASPSTPPKKEDDDLDSLLSSLDD